MNVQKIAEDFLSLCIQEWGFPHERRIAAAQAIIDAAGFDAKVERWPVFDKWRPHGCAGSDADAANKWMNDMINAMPRGRYQTETAHIAKWINDRRALDDAASKE